MKKTRPILYPNKHYIATKEPCCHIKIDHRVDKATLLAVIRYETQYEPPEKIAALTRKAIVDRLRQIFEGDGSGWFDKEGYCVEYHPEKGYIFPAGEKKESIETTWKVALRLFPDWFASNSVKAILDMAES